MWIFLYHIHKTFLFNAVIRNAPIRDEVTLEQILSLLKTSMDPDAAGLLRLVMEDVQLDCCFPRDLQVGDERNPKNDIVLDIRVDSFVSPTLPESFIFDGAVLALNGDPLLTVSHLDVTHVADNDSSRLYGWLCHEAKCRLRAVSSTNLLTRRAVPPPSFELADGLSR